jgi:formate hydrogenlyase subunit 3/multisubunit Na+/H+ antiporter MnhD subunit
MTATQALLVVAPLWPMVVALLWLLRPVRRHLPGLAVTMAWPALLLAFTADATMQLSVPGLFTSMSLGIDPVGRAFLLLTALLWTVVGVFAHSYMKSDARRASFTGFLLFTGAGNVGVTLSHDMLSFYLFFALMTFAAYGLVVHTRAADALRAGRVYIVMAVAGEALVVAGLFALVAANAGTLFDDVPEIYRSLAQPELVATLLLFGFGVKAGLVPLHVWLPLAHPVAPTPASALLSGALIKAGVLGWLRFLPVGDLSMPTLGAVTMTLGVFATIVAAAVGVTQRDPKTVLAYSSISQMGFLTVGIGAALLLPTAAPLLVLGVAVYALHHAPAKAALFLAVALVRSRTRRWVLVVAALPALVLAGAPLTSGAIAKMSLKAGLVDVPQTWPVSVDVLLSVAAVGTTLLMARFLASLVADVATPAHGARSAGMLLSWLLMVALSCVAALWLPFTLASLGPLPLATDPSYLTAALWPIVLGAALAGTSLLLVRRYPALTTARVPAGDIVTLFEHGAIRARSVSRRLEKAAPRTWWSAQWRRVNRMAGAAIDRAAIRVEGLAAGPLMGVVLCALALVMFLMVR